MIEDAAAALHKDDQDLVVSVGSRSSLDTAKFAAVLAEHGLPTCEMLGMGKRAQVGRPITLLLTIAGTGSEVTNIRVFSDPEDGGIKHIVYSEHFFADLTVVDPELTQSLSKGVTAATGLDSLTHAIKSHPTTPIFMSRSSPVTIGRLPRIVRKMTVPT